MLQRPLWTIAKLHVEKFPLSKVLVIASDIANMGSTPLENRLKELDLSLC